MKKAISKYAKICNTASFYGSECLRISKRSSGTSFTRSESCKRTVWDYGTVSGKRTTNGVYLHKETKTKITWGSVHNRRKTADLNKFSKHVTE